jgi:hypothetical protein
MDMVFLPASSAAAAPSRHAAAARIGFLLLFPGFFFYQTTIALGAMPAVLGGYFSIVSIVLLFPLALSYVIAVKRAGYRVARTDLHFALFLVYFFVVVAINAGFGAEIETIQTHLLSLLFFVNIYLIFRTIDFAERKTRAAATASLLLMSAIIFFYSANGAFQPGQVSAAKSAESLATYQGFARSYALTFVGVICFTRRAIWRMVFSLIAVAALVLNGSRSELVAVLCIVPLVELYRAKSRVAMMCAVLLVAAVAALNMEFAVQAIPDSRVWELFDLTQSNSSQDRHQMAQRALSTIAEHPLLGEYAGYPHGMYSHDILSAWVDLGLFGFAYLLFMLVPTAFKLFAGGWSLRARSGHFLMACSLVCMSLLLLVTAKAFDDMFVGAALGAYAHYRNRPRQAAPPQGSNHD